jgi:hypothetical protein
MELEEEEEEEEENQKMKGDKGRILTAFNSLMLMLMWMELGKTFSAGAGFERESFFWRIRVKMSPQHGNERMGPCARLTWLGRC